ncbi:F-box/kelch-repeat protein At1g55270 [Selaginella moellendorffii]|uniref:F-box/kelch-repeat protein At1g55270 n=1 Tax=Selaginella moellendorffii TaxID=88036 RepID=UPI000D1C2F1A|nr:F-box/kelch-repeat protein At1g55270 [Selaginella moellendorffii]|eukprot:XP_024543746.1 F-box/kelch-repeat protein At1g55270 [Selaginella moellendorffii]
MIQQEIFDLSMGLAMSSSQAPHSSCLGMRFQRRLHRQKLYIRKRAGQLWRFVKKLRVRLFLGGRGGRNRVVASEQHQAPAPAPAPGGGECSTPSRKNPRNKIKIVKKSTSILFEEVQAPAGEWSLIPGLPHDVALQCLARVPRVEHCLLRAVCRSWRWIVETPDFVEQRRLLGCAEDWLYLHVGTSPHLDERRDRDGSSKRGSSSGGKWQLVGGFSLWHALDPYRYKWHALPPIPYDESVTGGQVVLGATSVVMNGNLFVIGGAPFGKAAIRDVWVYNPLRNRWKRAAQMITPRFACLAATIKGKLYVIGGSGICHLTGYSLPCLEVYNPKTDSWSYKASARGIVTAHPCSPLKYIAVVDDKLCVIGPQNVTGRINAGMYDPESDSWLEIKPGLRSGWGKASTVMDGLLYTLDFGCYQQYVAEKDSWLPVKGKNADSLLEWDPRLVSAMAGSNGKLYMVGTMGPALIVVIAPVRGGKVNQNVCWHTMKLPNGVDFLGDLGHCSCQVITF